MSTQSRPKNSSVIEQLLDTPHAFSFFQAVRLLERASLFDSRDNNKLAAKNSIAGFAPPTTEFLRLKSNASFSFPESEINSISRNANQQNLSQWEMQVNFIGLAGCIGVLPFHYTELILKRLKQKDETLLHFLDLFNHRTASLFYQAATKYQFPIEYERKNLQKSQ